MDPVYIHLKVIDSGEDLVLKQVVDLQIRAEDIPLGVEDDSPAVGNVASAYRCLHSTDITDESTLVVGWHMVQEPGDYGEYFE